MILNTTWHHIRRSPFQSLTAILVLWLTFFFGSLFTFTTDGLNNVLTHFETKPEITIFLKDGLDKTTVETIQAELAAYPSIKEIKFISKDKALDIFKDQNQNNPLLLQMVTASVLPASFEVAVTDPKVLSQIAENFTPKTNIVDEIIYQKDIIKSLLSWTNIIRQPGLFTTIALSSITFLLIFAIIGMKITNRKEEVNISRLLGASKKYVKSPFLLEGVIYGLLGSVSGFTAAAALVIYFTPKINTFFQPVTFVTSDPIYFIKVFGLEIILGALMGFLASWFGVRRYIKY